MSVLVTVGTTKFDALIEEVDKQKFHNELLLRGYTKLEIQYGSGKYKPQERLVKSNFDNKVLEIKSKPYINEIVYNDYDLIVGHAGAGTILNALRNNKKMIVIINSTLMNNHQSELALKLHNDRHLIAIYDPSKLCESVNEISSIKLVPFPKAEKGLFKQKLNKLMSASLWKT